MKTMRMLKTVLSALLVVVVASCAKSQKNPQVIIHTTLGDVTVMLYNETPLHRDNFLKLVNEHFYDSLMFHRIIPGFMVQGGDPAYKVGPSGAVVGKKWTAYTIPAEIVYPRYYHKKGALAAARFGDEQNPEKRSSGSQFYIVQGEPISPMQMSDVEAGLSQKKKQQAGFKAFGQFRDSLKYYAQARDSIKFVNLRKRAVALAEEAAQKEPDFVMPGEVKSAYQSIGGTPHLDGDYTVFGEVVSGLDVVDKIAAIPTDGSDRPQQSVMMWMEVVK